MNLRCDKIRLVCPVRTGADFPRANGLFATSEPPKVRGAVPSNAWGKTRSGRDTIEGKITIVIIIVIDIVTKRVDSCSCQTNLLKFLGRDRETGIATRLGVHRGMERER